MAWVAFLVVGLALSSLLVIAVGLGKKSAKHARHNSAHRASRN